MERDLSISVAGTVVRKAHQQSSLLAAFQAPVREALEVRLWGRHLGVAALLFAVEPHIDTDHTHHLPLRLVQPVLAEAADPSKVSIWARPVEGEAGQHVVRPLEAPEAEN